MEAKSQLGSCFSSWRYTHMISILKKIQYGLVLALMIILSETSVHAQSQQPTFVPVESESLSGNFVRCIFKDSRGFMWFGTMNGLIRYDGTDTYTYEYTEGDNKSIPNNRINAIVEDASHNLWIGTAHGLVQYDGEKDSFKDIDSIPGNTNHLISRYISDLCFDRQGKLWIGTHGYGLQIYDPKTYTFTFLDNTGEEKPLTDYITRLYLVNGSMWVGTKGGLRLFNTQTMLPESLPVADESLASKETKQIIQDPSGNIWLGLADREIIRLTSNDREYRMSKSVLEQNIYGKGGDNILTFCFDRVGNLWIGGENSGLNYLDTKTNTITHYESEEDDPKKLPTNSIQFIYRDNAGIIWIGTFDKGAYLIDNNAKKFQTYQNLRSKGGLNGNNIMSLAEDKDGNIWIASNGGGLYKLDITSNELGEHEMINNKIGTYYLSALLYDSNGALWIGTWGRGVYKINLKTLDVENYSVGSHGFGDNKVLCVYEDERKKMWVGTAGSGLFYFDSMSNQFTLFNDERKVDGVSRTTYVTSIIDGADNTLWIGTLYGLHSFKVEQNNFDEFKVYLKDKPGDIGSNEILNAHKGVGNELWFGTGDNGISILSSTGSDFRVVRKQDGLHSNTVKGILTDARGNIWVSSNLGLSKYTPATNSFLNFTIGDGLPSNDFNSRACLIAGNGRLYFGTNNGLVAFYPDSILSNPIKPVVYLTDLKIDNRSARIDGEGSPLKKHISLTHDIELPYYQRSFVIDFAANNYGQSSRNQYCYKLEGFDNDWNCVGSNHSATYTNIDPGQYVFLVKASNSDGIESEAPTRLNVTIHQAPWKTWWAILLYVILLTAFIYFLVRVRLERIKIKNQLELERLAREKEHELSESKTQFFTNISHELRTPLSLIFMPLENLISIEELSPTVKERLNTIRTNTDKMSRLVNELMDFNKLESSKLKLRVQQGELVKFITERATVFNDLAEKRNIHFGIHSMVRSIDGWFDFDKLEKILVNVLSNAFKFTSDNGSINVSINTKVAWIDNVHKEARCLELVIVDNGIGISVEELPFIFDKFYQAKSSAKIPNPGTGIGLSLTKGLVELHYGSITVESAPDHETKFRILLPIDRQLYTDEICEIPDYIVAPDNMRPVEKNISSDTEAVMDQDQPQVLIVEDNDELRRYISMELGQQFNILEAKDGDEGLEIACEKSPDLIISDVMMPIKNGIELCHEIKSNIKTSHIPLVLLTAKTSVDDQVNGIANGADVYITKPFSIRFLVAQVNQIIESRQKLYSRFSQDIYLLPGKVSGSEIDQAFLQKAIDYIIDNLQEAQLGVDSIANLFNLSRMQVYRKIKALTGKSVVDFIKMVRIKQALKLMEAQKYTLSEVAFRTGFNSSSYFTRCFKDQYGKAPSEYLESRS